MILLQFPTISQADFSDAFQVLDECIVRKLPCWGFERPFMGPGGQYGSCWWERDSALTLNGYKWLDQRFAEQVLLNFVDVQKPNGRIPLYGMDRVEDFDEELSAIPVLFESAWRILRRTTDHTYIRKIYGMLVRYMDWWMSDTKRDPETGLCCGIFEESDPCDFHDQHTAAQVDLNVQICVGADVLSDIAAYLGLYQDSARYAALFAEHRERINRFLFNPGDGCYYTLLTGERRLQTERVYNSMFDTFKRRILPRERADGLLKYLTDPRYFGFGEKYGLTTMAKTCNQYTETVGIYQGSPSWRGNIWTMRNEIIVTGLREYGLRELSARIAWQTVTEFCGNYTEFLSPSTGEGHGVKRYGWTASQFIQLLVEELLGIDWCAWDGRVTLSPNLPPELYGQTVSICNLPLGDGRLLHAAVRAEAEGVQTRYAVTKQETDTFTL